MTINKLDNAIIATKPDASDVETEYEQMESVLHANGTKYTYLPIDEITFEMLTDSHPDIGIIIGGDGMFLEGVRRFAPHNIPIMGINGGTLGFLTRTTPDNASNAVASIFKDEHEIIDREQLRATGPVNGVGINDVMMEPLPPESPTDRKICSIHVYIDDEYTGKYDGSGVAVSTPTGSTAVALSAGGPIHYPNQNESLQITPLNTHNIGVRPVIVDSQTKIQLVPDDDVRVMVDGGRQSGVVSSGEEIVVTGASQTAKIVRTPFDETFFDALSGKLGWGLREVDESGPYK